MKAILSSLVLCTGSLGATDIFTFKQSANTSEWMIVNDGVMGGLSQGSFNLDENGYGVFTGSNFIRK